MDSVYIPSRGRYKTMSTHRHFERKGMKNWYYVVEPFELLEYINALAAEGIENPEQHVLAFDPDVYKEPFHPVTNPKGYEYFDEFGWKPGLTTGPGPARNALIDFARERGEKHLWMMDDDIVLFAVDAFYFQKGVYTKGTKNRPGHERIDLIKCFELFERFLDKYDNVGLAEFEKSGMAMNHRRNKHLAIGGKTYSCIRINTEINIPWRSRYNDDVVYSLDYLKRGYVNVSSKIIAYATPESQQQAGGMTSAFKELGTLDKVRHLVKAFPDVSKLALKYGRIHHQVAYNRFKNPLILRESASLDDLVFDLDSLGIDLDALALETESA